MDSLLNQGINQYANKSANELAKRHIWEMQEYWYRRNEYVHNAYLMGQAVHDELDEKRRTQREAALGVNIKHKQPEGTPKGCLLTQKDIPAFYLNQEAVNGIIVEKFFPLDAAEKLNEELTLSTKEGAIFVIRCVYCLCCFYNFLFSRFQESRLKGKSFEVPLGLLLHMSEVAMVVDYFATVLCCGAAMGCDQLKIKAAKRNKLDLKIIPRKKLVQDFFLSKGPDWISRQVSQSKIVQALRAYATTGKNQSIAGLTDRRVKQFIEGMLASKEFSPEIEAALREKFPNNS